MRRGGEDWKRRWTSSSTACKRAATATINHTQPDLRAPRCIQKFFLHGEHPAAGFGHILQRKAVPQQSGPRPLRRHGDVHLSHRTAYDLDLLVSRQILGFHARGYGRIATRHNNTGLHADTVLAALHGGHRQSLLGDCLALVAILAGVVVFPADRRHTAVTPLYRAAAPLS